MSLKHIGTRSLYYCSTTTIIVTRNWYSMYKFILKQDDRDLWSLNFSTACIDYILHTNLKSCKSREKCSFVKNKNKMFGLNFISIIIIIRSERPFFVTFLIKKLSFLYGLNGLGKLLGNLTMWCWMSYVSRRSAGHPPGVPTTSPCTRA